MTTSVLTQPPPPAAETPAVLRPGTVPAAPAVPPLRLLPAVSTEPPYEEDVPDRPVDLVPFALQLARAVAAPELDLPELARQPADDAAGPSGTGPTVAADLRRLFGHRRTPRAELPAPGPRAATAVRLLLEVLAGDRPSRQVAGWVSPGVLAGLERRRPPEHRRLPRRPLLRSLRVCEPADGVAEVSAVVEVGPRHRAVALRLDGLDGRWTVTALHVG